MGHRRYTPVNVIVGLYSRLKSFDKFFPCVFGQSYEGCPSDSAYAYPAECCQDFFTLDVMFNYPPVIVMLFSVDFDIHLLARPSEVQKVSVNMVIENRICKNLKEVLFRIASPFFSLCRPYTLSLVRLFQSIRNVFPMFSRQMFSFPRSCFPRLSSWRNWYSQFFRLGKLVPSFVTLPCLLLPFLVMCPLFNVLAIWILFAQPFMVSQGVLVFPL